ncbi:MAG: hypothetical protein M1836_002041 [Candelina mexicana]|nr:MAG: hypothetical protein M1836_002041 [Candelina mexicana]
MFARRAASKYSSLTLGPSASWRAPAASPQIRDATFTSNVPGAVKMSASGRIDPPSNFARSQRYLATVTETHNAVLAPLNTDERRRITFVDKTGASHPCEVADGVTLLEVAKSEGLEVEGACGGDCACSTCHVIVTSPSRYNAIDAPTDRENDMLDMAFEVTDTSRLGCQVKVDKRLEGLEVKLPGITSDLHAN